MFVCLIDLSTTHAHMYDVDQSLDSEEIEEYLESKGHHMSNCSWGCIEGFTDERDET